MALKQRPRRGGAPRGPRQERGVALLMALVVVAIAVTAAAGFAVQQQLTIRRTGNMLASEQAYLLARAGERWATTVLLEDLEDNSAVDSLDEDWAQMLPPTPVDEAVLWGQISDLQGLLNINDLVNPDGSINPVMQDRFERLVLNAEFEDRPPVTPTVVNAIIDWIDSDVQSRLPDGAEDGYYTGLEQPYRPPNQPMADRSELRLVRGIDAQLYAYLAPNVAALPQGTPLNVNTAPRAVLMALFEDVAEADADALIDRRDEEAFDSVNAFLDDPALRGREVSDAGLGVTSNYFLVQAYVSLGPARVGLNSRLERASGQNIATLSRQRGTYRSWQTRSSSDSENDAEAASRAQETGNPPRP